MKKPRYTEEQIAYTLKQAETGVAVGGHPLDGDSEQTFHRWKSCKAAGVRASCGG